MKLRFQLALLVVVAVVASLFAVGFFTLKLTRAALEYDARVEAQESATDFNRALSRLPPVTNDRIAKEIEIAMRRNRRVVGVELLLAAVDGHNYRFDLQSRAEAPVISPLTDPLPATQSASIQTRNLPAVADTPRGIEVTVPLHVEPDKAGKPIRGDRGEKPRIGMGWLTLTLSMDSVDKLLARQKQVTFSVAAIAVLLASLLSVLLADRIIGRPLGRLARVMGDVSEGALDRRVQSVGPPEIQAVSNAFNKMLDRLQEADRAIRSFNERLANEVKTATAALSDQNAALNHLNTLLVRAREDLSHKERLAAIGQLAAQLAHEIGTPLGSVSGHLQLALASPDCSTSVHDRLLIASQEIARVSRIIRDYLDSTRRIEPEVSDVAVERVLHEAVEVARGGSPSRSAQVQIEVAPEALRWRTDEGVIRQILVNLTANALDAVATPREGERGLVQVRAQLEDARVPGRTQDLVVRVLDNGQGIAPEALGRMFEPFYTTKGRGKGTGLGLAICRELTQSLGGRIANGDEIARRAQTAGAKPLSSALH
jgi:signal transduction histidine kinase